PRGTCLSILSSLSFLLLSSLISHYNTPFPILHKIIITPTDSMDTSSTNSSISIEDYSGKNIDIKSFEWSEGNTMVGVKIDTLDYLTEYRITVSDDAKNHLT
ncbi:hypothetical protein DRQ23_09295, partial [bacterium]